MWHGDRSQPALALTFDDGPTPGTEQILRVLGEYRVRATFFQCGEQVRRRPDLARAAAALHEIGNHSDTHARLYLRSSAFIRRELERAQTAIRDATGVTPALFRAPYGVRWFGLRAAQEKLGLLGVMWTVIGRDWRDSAREVAERVLHSAGNGAIVCLHDGRELSPAPDIANTVEAVRRIVPALLDRGYRLQTVSEVLCRTT